MSIDSQVLRRFTLFEGYSDDDLQTYVRPHLQQLIVEPGQIICHERAPGHRCFFLLSGDVEVRVGLPSGRQEPVGRLGEGSLFGQIAMLDGGTRSATCVALTPCHMLTLERFEFDRLRRSGNPFAFDLLRQITTSLADQVRQAIEGLSAMSESRVEDRIVFSERLRTFVHGGPQSGDTQQGASPAGGLRLRRVKL